MAKRKQKSTLKTCCEVPLQSFSHMGVQASSGRSLSTENCFISHMLPYKLLI